MDDERKLTIAIRHYPESNQHNVDDIDIGPLVSSLSEPPAYLAYDASGEYQEGTIELSIKRTHEWEYELGLTIAESAGGAFTNAVITAIGERVYKWITDRLERQGENEPGQIRDDEGATVDVDPDEMSGSQDDLAHVLDEASKRGGTVIIRFPME